MPSPPAVPPLPPPDRTRYTHIIHEVADLHHLPFDLLQAQVLIESAGDAAAFRYEEGYFLRYIQGKPHVKGAVYGPLAACSYGLLQIVLETALEMGYQGRPEELFDPLTGLSWGAKKMRALWTWAGGALTDYEQALAAYNGGTGGNSVRPFRNQAYVDLVYKQAATSAAGGTGGAVSI